MNVLGSIEDVFPRSVMQELKQAMDAGVEWKHWGGLDPLFGVLAFPGKRKGDASPWQSGEFFQTGEEDWSKLWSIWHQYGVDDSSCLDLGCGVGRVSRPMSRHFGHVHAVDVSPGMLEYANTWSAPNVTFHLVEKEFPLPPASVGAVFSLHMFNVLASVEDQRECFRSIFNVLKPGGTMLVQLPVYSLPMAGAKLVHKVYHLLQWVRRLQQNLRRRLLRKGHNTPFMCYTEMSTTELVSLLGSIGFAGVEIRTLPMYGTMTIVLGTKP